MLAGILEYKKKKKKKEMRMVWMYPRAAETLLAICLFVCLFISWNSQSWWRMTSVGRWTSGVVDQSIVCVLSVVRVSASTSPQDFLSSSLAETDGRTEGRFSYLRLPTTTKAVRMRKKRRIVERGSLSKETFPSLSSLVVVAVMMIITTIPSIHR